ncbi:hypothetical protein LIA77_08546 [Sarocladium implicatum]|nr:hypothetical protein LIA77_08546 [Sarocladium implicatum]
MERPVQSNAGSVKRARERAQAGLPREPLPMRQPQMIQDSSQTGLSPPPSRPAQGPNAAPQRAYRPREAPPIEGRAGQPISRPTRIPQWPLPSSPVSPLPAATGEPYRPPPNRPQQAPQRPPRPSLVPSIVNQSRLQEPTPVFFAKDVTENDNYGAEGQQPGSPTSRLTISSVGSIPDFPEPGISGPTMPRRSANLGPPPSSRRGASSFYSHASYVSPIPEESPRSRSHLSGASSGVMPSGHRVASPVSPGYSDTYYEESVTDENSRASGYEDFGDESKLVRSASIGKKGKPALVVTRPPGNGAKAPQGNSSSPFVGGTGFKEEDTGSSTDPSSAKVSPESTPGEEGAPVTSEAMLGAYAAASSGQNMLRKLTPSPKPPSRLSGLKRPPKLDIDAVREMEARGSITSLPDLIRRATRLAAMMDRGKRPGSRFDNLADYLDDSNGSRDGEKDGTLDEKHQSGFSDMLAAFPPPAQEGRQTRSSWFRTTSWPLAPGRQGSQPQRGMVKDGVDDQSPPKPKRRRCCGMPMWLFIIVVILVLCAVAAAIVVPLQFFVFKNLGPQAEAESSLDKCRSQLNCRNGGANVISQGTCSCVCTSGFVGKECEVGGSRGCTTTNLVSSNGETTVQNVTLGRSVPRVIAQSAANFSVPLSGTVILAKFSAANTSCIAQNSLVTFNGQSVREGGSTAETKSIDEVKGDSVNIALEVEQFVSITALTEPMPLMTAPPILAERFDAELAPRQNQDTLTELLVDTSMPTAPTKTSASAEATGTTDSGADEDAFVATDEVLDFARVAVLYILQEEDPDSAQSAQGTIQKFFDRAADSDDREAVLKEAAELRVGSNTTLNFVDFAIELGSRRVGGDNTTESSPSKREASRSSPREPMLSRHFHMRAGNWVIAR